MHLPAFAVSATITPTPEVDPDLVTPGVWGFAIIVFIAVAVILLIWDMLRRIRRGRVRAEIAEELDAEEAARAAEAPGDGDGDGASEADPEGSRERD